MFSYRKVCVYACLVGWLVWFYCVLTIFRLFNVKSCLNLRIKYMICKHISLITFWNKPELIFFSQLNCFKYWYVTVICFKWLRTNLFADSCCLYTVKRLQLLSLTTYSIQYQISCLLTVKWLQVLLTLIILFNTIDSFRTQWNSSKYCYVIPIFQSRHTVK